MHLEPGAPALLTGLLYRDPRDSEDLPGQVEAEYFSLSTVLLPEYLLLVFACDISPVILEYKDDPVRNFPGNRGRSG
jgi:hypothetical protein